MRSLEREIPSYAIHKYFVIKLEWFIQKGQRRHMLQCTPNGMYTPIFQQNHMDLIAECERI